MFYLSVVYTTIHKFGVVFFFKEIIKQVLNKLIQMNSKDIDKLLSAFIIIRNIFS